MSEIARAFWIAAPGVGEIRDENLPAPGPGDVLVRSLYSAVSRGTESLVFEGRVPVSEHERMRCPHQSGAFPAPVKYGYANVGRVALGPQELIGRAVFCLYPHQSAYVVAAVAVVPLPDGLEPARAVLAASMETALNAAWDAAPRMGDRVTVVGAGVVGSLVAYLIGRLPGADVELVDTRPERAEIARALGVRFATPPAARGERDLVLHASATAQGLRSCLELAAREATIVELSWFGDRDVALPLGQAFHVKRLTLRSSQVGTVSPRARARQSHRSRLELALSFCIDPALDVLIDGEGPLDDLPAAMVRLAPASSGALCHRVRYE
jgi:threonine dehydrogenase-like Zn-dependent dehydrogenase